MRLLVVEDESLIAILIEQALTDLGHSLVGPVPRLAQAMEVAREVEVDAAILDINLRGEPIYPAAAILAKRGIPFVFVSGYNPGEVDERFRDRPLLRKPFTGEDLRKCLEKAMHPTAAG